MLGVNNKSSPHQNQQKLTEINVLDGASLSKILMKQTWNILKSIKSIGQYFCMFRNANGSKNKNF